MTYLISSSKATPNKAIHYCNDKAILKPDGTRWNDTFNMVCDGSSDSEDKIAEFLDLASFNENMGYNMRKYYHLKFSPAEKDSDPDKLIKYVKKFLQEKYPKCQATISIHNDNGRVHAHVIMNAVLLNYYKVQDKEQDRFAKQEYAMDTLAKEFGFQPTTMEEYLTTTNSKNKLIDYQFKKTGKTSDRDKLREIIDDALLEVKKYDEFEKYLEVNDIKIIKCKESVLLKDNKTGRIAYDYIETIDKKGNKNKKKIFKTQQIDQIKYKYKGRTYRCRSLGWEYSLPAIEYSLGIYDKKKYNMSVEEIKKSLTHTKEKYTKEIKEKIRSKYLSNEQKLDFEKQLNDILKNTINSDDTIIQYLIKLLSAIIEIISINIKTIEKEKTK